MEMVAQSYPGLLNFQRYVMLEYIGKYASCHVMIDEIEPESVRQIYGFLNNPAFEGSKIRIMPDCHSGKGSVIGFTGTLVEKIIPQVIGVDIGCGVLSACFGVKKSVDFNGLDKHVRANIPSGFNVKERATKQLEASEEGELYTKTALDTKQDTSRVLSSIGTLGGGNHFIEVGRDQHNRIWATIHSGSRNFGLKICTFHQEIASGGKAGHGLEWLEGELAQKYLEHMKVAQQYAQHNRREMMKVLSKFWKEDPEDEVESVHNYINFTDKIIRKGAISAHLDERVVIPWNMRDGLIIGRGKGNLEWNYSAPHGAGRLMSRGEAKRSFTLTQFKSSMEGIWSSCVVKDTIDESPMAYKPYESIQTSIAETVDIELVVKPIYSFKASKDPR